jgi:hypothetical protein
VPEEDSNTCDTNAKAIDFDRKELLLAMMSGDVLGFSRVFSWQDSPGSTLT